MREIEDMQGILAGGHSINNPRYAEDTVLISESQDQLQELLNKVIEASEAKALTIDFTKTECLVVTVLRKVSFRNASYR